MKKSVLAMCLCLGISPAWSEDIGEVLQRSQDMRLATFAVASADAPGARALQASFERLRRGLNIGAGVELRIVGAGTIAETFHGRTVVIEVSAGELPEACRLFLLAHELGHVTQGHWAERVQLYRRFIPGEVVQAQTDSIAAQLGRAASQQSHEHEYAADAFAMRTLLDMGYGRDDLLEMFARLGHHGATSTHPSSGQRLAQLRQIEAERALAKAQ